MSFFALFFTLCASGWVSEAAKSLKRFKKESREQRAREARKSIIVKDDYDRVKTLLVQHADSVFDLKMRVAAKFRGQKGQQGSNAGPQMSQKQKAKETQTRATRNQRIVMSRHQHDIHIC